MSFFFLLSNKEGTCSKHTNSCQYPDDVKLPGEDRPVLLATAKTLHSSHCSLLFVNGSETIILWYLKLSNVSKSGHKIWLLELHQSPAFTRYETTHHLTKRKLSYDGKWKVKRKKLSMLQKLFFLSLTNE